MWVLERAELVVEPTDMETVSPSVSALPPDVHSIS